MASAICVSAVATWLLAVSGPVPSEIGDGYLSCHTDKAQCDVIAAAMNVAFAMTHAEGETFTATCVEQTPVKRGLFKENGQTLFGLSDPNKL
jgi:hypothetical protein